MKKSVLVPILCGLCVFLLCACRAPGEEARGIAVGGVFYAIAPSPMPAEVDESAIIGYVTGYTPDRPAAEGETNLDPAPVGAPYARVEGGIALLYGNEWYLCTPLTPEGPSR